MQDIRRDLRGPHPVKAESFVPITDDLNDLLKYIGMRLQITKLKRFRKFIAKIGKPDLRSGLFISKFNTYSSTRRHIEGNDGVLIMIHLVQAFQAGMDPARRT